MINEGKGEGLAVGRNAGERGEMTLSILMRDGKRGLIGCAAATGNLAVGGWVLRAAAGAGAVATQGLSVSTLWGDEALLALGAGERAEAVLQRLVEADPGREHRQLSLLDREGGVAAWTGSANEEARGHILGEGYVIAGNWLSSPAVLEAMERTFLAGRSGKTSAPAARLLQVLEAGVAAGSDSRGTLSAALRLVSAEWPPLDLRVDFDEAPVARLRRLYEMATSAPYSDWVGRVPTQAAPHRF